jgi:cyclohexa-1,5-dienecarbonyl-CoA hydratase
MAEQKESIRSERDGRVATLWLDRPPLNILDLAMLAELGTAVEELAGDEALQLVVVRGAGEKAFSAGVSVQDHTEEKVPEMLRRFHGALSALSRLPALTLAAVHGHCLGGGMELAAACDFVLAGAEARFGQPEVELGCFPPYAAALYPRWLGRARSLELLVTGRLIGAAEAEALGFVTWRATAGAFDERLAELTEQLTGKSAAVSRLAKRAVDAGTHQPFDDALAEAERLYLEELVATEDMHEGLAAFLAKRMARWKHR